MKNNMIKVIISNSVFFMIGLVTNFLLPKYLSIETYSDIKTYALYLSYAGLFTIGFADGIFIKYGGKDIKSIQSIPSFSNDLLNYIYLEVFMTILLFVASIIKKDLVLCFLSLGLIFENGLWYYRLVFQSTGEFSDYGKALNFQKILLFIIEMILIFVIKIDHSIFYLAATVFVSILGFSYITYLINKKYVQLSFSKINFKSIYSNCKNGFILMMGNFSNTLFTGIDRWFVKILLSTKDFALYAFAVSMENMVNLFITPISLSLYNELCKRKNIEFVKKLKIYVLIMGACIIALAFPAKFILEIFLTKYLDANLVIFYLFATQFFYAIIKGIYLNIYKSNNQQKKYLFQTISTTIITIALNSVLFIFIKSIVAFAIGTLLTSIIWLIICEVDSEIKYSLKEYIFMLVIIVSYLISGYMFNAITGAITYLFVLLFMLTIFYRNVINELVRMIFKSKEKEQ